MPEGFGHSDVEGRYPVAGMSQLSKEAHDGPRGEDAAGQGKDRLVQVECRRIIDIDEVSQNDIELARRIGEKGSNVFDADLDTRVIEAPFVKIRQVLAASLDNHTVDVDENHFFHTRVAEDLTQSETVSSTLNEDASRRWVKEQGRDREMFVIDEFIQLEELDDAV
jgi:hypothetical protein